ncbi:MULTISPECIES: tyrosine-protein phosphatase [unclassified Luteococcus]|uniref:tyrosine-protein phosphatase n=1 Tax=unclassified Luteococcus TaxID=2639923 RepID=UPI00313DDFC5
MELPEIGWIDLPGVVNMRDIGGKPTPDGARTRRGVVIRTDNLQDLPPASVRRLVDEFGVTDVVDLRTNLERASTGDGPLKAEPLTFHELTLYPEDSAETGIPDDEEEEQAQLPWKDEQVLLDRQNSSHEEHLANHYFGYLNGRPEHVVAAIRAIAQAPGAVLVHCAAGKDRTGTIIAMSLTEVGVQREAVVADYDATNQRVELIFNRLANTETYREDLAGQQVADQSTPAATMQMLLTALDEEYGTEQFSGVHGWLVAHGWTDEDHAALRAKLLQDTPEEETK